MLKRTVGCRHPTVAKGQTGVARATAVVFLDWDTDSSALFIGFLGVGSVQE